MSYEIRNESHEIRNEFARDSYQGMPSGMPACTTGSRL
jgi:hypothetical protein